jgi:very-short-patch-repair endonuclease
MSALEEALMQQIRALKLDGFVREFTPIKGRRWRVDFAHAEKRIAVEVEGGTWSGGRHTRGKGFEQDCEKYAALTLDGWRVLRVTGKHIKSGEAVAWIERALA